MIEYNAELSNELTDFHLIWNEHVTLYKSGTDKHKDVYICSLPF